MPQSFKEYFYKWTVALGELGLGSNFPKVFKSKLANFKRNFSSFSPTAKILTFAVPISLAPLAPVALAAAQKGAEQLKQAVEKKSPQAAALINKGIAKLTK